VHQHSTNNVFQRIFYGLTLNSTVFADIVRLTVSPYVRGQDLLSVIQNDYAKKIKANFSESTGTMDLVHEGGGADLTKDDWDNVLNFPTYKLQINNNNPRACARYTKGLYPRTFSLQMIDRYGRLSNVVTRELIVKTAIIMYTSTKPVRNTNGATYTSIVVTQNSFDPIHDLVNVSGSP